MVSVKLYVEGGGDSGVLRTQCRRGFCGFLEKAGFKGRMPRIVACGGRQDAYDRFKTACESGQTALLLIDSEDCVSATSPWQHLATRQGDGFAKPQNATDDHCHLMVVCMESWFLADKDALTRFFGQGFNVNALPQHTNIEAVSKTDTYDGMRKATAYCKAKPPYRKGDHSFVILLEIAPDKVRNASLWARRFFEYLDTFMTI
ncbi:MAG: DUF4276 family protein [Pseudomonadota bacterium]